MRHCRRLGHVLKRMSSLFGRIGWERWGGRDVWVNGGRSERSDGRSDRCAVSGGRWTVKYERSNRAKQEEQSLLGVVGYHVGLISTHMTVRQSRYPEVGSSILPGGILFASRLAVCCYQCRRLATHAHVFGDRIQLTCFLVDSSMLFGFMCRPVCSRTTKLGVTHSSNLLAAYSRAYTITRHYRERKTQLVS